MFCFGHWITSPRFAWIDFFWLLLQYWALGRLIQKGFFWRFISFRKSRSVWKVPDALKVILFLLCCSVISYCAEMLLMSCGLSCRFELLCCLLLCFMLFYACLPLCHHVYLPPSDLFNISIWQDIHQFQCIFWGMALPLFSWTHGMETQLSYERLYLTLIKLN